MDLEDIDLKDMDLESANGGEQRFPLRSAITKLMKRANAMT